MKPLPLFLTEDHPCSYLDGQWARSVFIHPSQPMSTTLYAQLIEQGFRRSGDEVYKPHCRHCQACIPARLEVAAFKPDRSQKRCRGKNRALEVQVKPPVFEQAHYDLYLRYQNARHEGGDMAQSSPEEYLGFLGSSWCDTKFVEFSHDGQLAALAVVDQLGAAWSAVYTFFDPALPASSLGTYAVLWQLEQAKQAGVKFLYLGFWIEACRKMAYKSQYRPMQGLLGGEWVEIIEAKADGGHG